MKRFLTIVGAAVGVLFLAICVLGLIFGKAPDRNATPTAQALAADAPTAVDVEATQAPEPTSRPDPTSVPEPTAAPTEIPTQTPLPEPIMLKGHGKVVTDKFTPPAAINRVVFTHSGKRNFIVHSFAADGKEDSIVNTIGAYQGARPLPGGQEFFFEVDADGDWTATIEPLSQNDTYATGLEGSGDVVSDLFMPTKNGAIPFTFDHSGKRNFIVHLYCAGGADPVANEIGTVHGEVVVRMSKGPCFWEVEADGSWSVKPK